MLLGHTSPQTWTDHDGRATKSFAPGHFLDRVYRPVGLRHGVAAIAHLCQGLCPAAWLGGRTLANWTVDRAFDVELFNHAVHLRALVGAIVGPRGAKARVDGRAGRVSRVLHAVRHR